MDEKLKALIEECKKQDKAGQRKLYNLLSPALYGICLKYMKDKTEADDVFQEAFIILFQKIKQYKYKGSFEGWAKRIFINKSLEVLRKKQRFLYVAVEESDISEDCNINNEESPKTEIPHDKLVEHIQELPDNYRIVFNLYVFEDYSHKAISEKLDIKIGTSKSLLSRAKAILRVKINEDLNRRVS